MALSKDLIFWGNPARREKVIRLHQELVCLMKDTFYALNRLASVSKKQHKNDGEVGRLLHSLPEIKVNQDETIEYNCAVFLSFAEALQLIYDKMDIATKQNLDPASYRLLYEPDRELLQATKFVGNCASIPTWVAFNGHALYTLVNPQILGKISTFFQCVKASCLAELPVFLLAVSIEGIFGAVLGYLEKNRLEGMIKELETLKGKFEPEVRAYTSNIYRVIAQYD